MKIKRQVPEMSKRRRDRLKTSTGRSGCSKFAAPGWTLVLLVSLSLAACGKHTQPLTFSGFEPHYPRSELVIDSGSFFDHKTQIYITFPEVDSLQPWFSWSAFPGVRSAPYSQAPFVEVDPARVGDVGYDLRIWRLKESAKELVYERYDIHENLHRVESPLQPGARYLWTVRARFEVDGEQRVSEWSMTLWPPVLPPGKTSVTPWEIATEYGYSREMARKLGSIPDANLFRFQTPDITAAESRVASTPAIDLAFAKRVFDAECGDASEQYDLGLMFEIGTEPAMERPVAAYKWLSLAASNGHAEAKDARNRLAARMPDAQIAEAERLVAEWEPDPATCAVEIAGTPSYPGRPPLGRTARTITPDTTGPMPKPELALGDTWIGLKDGKNFKWTVVSMDGDAYTGQASDGCRWTKISWDFAPAYEFRGCKPYKDGKHKITSITGKLWPLEVGNKISYGFIGSRPFQRSWRGTRTCEVESREAITIGGAQHDTFKIVCNDAWTRLTYYVSPRLKAVVYSERHRKSQGQTFKWELIRLHRAGSSDPVELAALQPPVNPNDQTEIAALPPVKSREEVEAYLNRNKKEIKARLAAYNQKNRVLVGNNSRLDVRRIHSMNIQSLNGESVLVRVSFELGRLGTSWFVGAGTFLFELKWIDGDLEFISHREV